MVIVAAVDRSDRAAQVIRQASTLAEAFDDPLHAVHVLTEAEFVDLGRTATEAGDPVDMAQIRGVATDIAADAAADLAAPFEAVGLVGDPADRLVDYAEDHDARYVVVAARRRSPAGKALFGSVAQTILLNASCPVVSTVASS